MMTKKKKLNINEEEEMSRISSRKLSDVFIEDNEVKFNKTRNSLLDNDQNQDSNKIILDKKSYDYTAPLACNGEEQQIISSPSTPNIIITTENNDSIDNNNSIQRVKFLSDYTINNVFEQQKEPLLQSDIRRKKLPEDRFTVLKEFNSKSRNDTNNHIRTNSYTSETNSGKEEKDKSIKMKYNRDSKSLEFSINIGNNKSKENGCFSQLKFVNFYQALFAEILGTYILVLYACSFGLPIAEHSHPSINSSIGSGLVVASLVWGMGHVGGANFNPAVSIALLITGKSNLVRVLFYIPCQLLGSTIAVLTLNEILPYSSHLNNQVSLSNHQNSSVFRFKRQLDSITSNNNKMELNQSQFPYKKIGLTLLNKDLTPIQGFSIELIITFILILTIFACIDTKRKDLHGSFPLTVGFAVMVGSLFGGGLTGGSMNPARSFGPALVNSRWENHQIYWFGPITGACIAAISYKLLTLKDIKI